MERLVDENHDFKVDSYAYFMCSEYKRFFVAAILSSLSNGIVITTDTVWTFQKAFLNTVHHLAVSTLVCGRVECLCLQYRMLNCVMYLMLS